MHAATASLLSTARSMFVPRGHLPAEYTRFQLLDALQGSSSYLRGVLTLHSTLVGAGMASGATASTAATIVTFILKDGSSHIGSLLFASLFSSHFDSEIKWWRLFADIINDVGLTLELAAPLGGPALFLPLTCAANVCKALCGVAAGATRVAISSHFASVVSGNSGGAPTAQIAEMQAKEGTQETAVTLLGLLLGLTFSTALNSSRTMQWTAFVLLTVVHVVANYRAVRTLQLRSLNRGRLSILAHAFGVRVSAGGTATSSPRSPGRRRRSSSAALIISPGEVRLPSPGEVAAMEPVFPSHFAPPMLGGSRLRLRFGASWTTLLRLASSCAQCEDERDCGRALLAVVDAPGPSNARWAPKILSQRGLKSKQLSMLDGERPGWSGVLVAACGSGDALDVVVSIVGQPSKRLLLYVLFSVDTLVRSHRGGRFVLDSPPSSRWPCCVALASLENRLRTSVEREFSDFVIALQHAGFNAEDLAIADDGYRLQAVTPA